MRSLPAASGFSFIAAGDMRWPRSFTRIVLNWLGYRELHQLCFLFWRQVKRRRFVHADLERLYLLIFVFDLEMPHQYCILLFADAADIAHNSGDHDLVEIERRLGVLVLEMHLDTVQLGQFGVAHEANVRRKHFANVGSSLFWSFVIGIASILVFWRVVLINLRLRGVWRV